MEIRRFGVGNRRPDGPPGTTGVAGQVIHADAPRDRVGARLRPARRRSSRTPTRTRPGSSSSRAAAWSRSATSGPGSRPARRSSGRPTSPTAPGPSCPRCGRSSWSSPAPDDAHLRGILDGRAARARAEGGRRAGDAAAAADARRRASLAAPTAARLGGSHGDARCSGRLARPPSDGRALASPRREPSPTPRAMRASACRSGAPSRSMPRAATPRRAPPRAGRGSRPSRPTRSAPRRGRRRSGAAGRAGPGRRSGRDVGQERRHRRLQDRRHLAGVRHEGRAARGDGHDRGHEEVAGRDPERVEAADDLDAGGVRVEPDLLLGLAQRGRDGVGVAGLGLAARAATPRPSGGPRRTRRARSGRGAPRRPGRGRRGRGRRPAGRRAAAPAARTGRRRAAAPGAATPAAAAAAAARRRTGRGPRRASSAHGTSAASRAARSPGRRSRRAARHRL